MVITALFTFSGAHCGEAGLESQQEVHSVAGLLCWLLSSLMLASHQAGDIGGAGAAGAKARGAPAGNALLPAALRGPCEALLHQLNGTMDKSRPLRAPPPLP